MARHDILVGSQIVGEAGGDGGRAGAGGGAVEVAERLLERPRFHPFSSCFALFERLFHAQVPWRTPCTASARPRRHWRSWRRRAANEPTSFFLLKSLWNSPKPLSKGDFLRALFLPTRKDVLELKSSAAPAPAVQEAVALIFRGREKALETDF